MISRFLYSTVLATGLLLGATQLYAAPPHVGTVPVRAGLHDRFNRIVIDWKTPVTYTMKQSNGRVEIQFDHAAQLALGNVTAVRPPFIRNLTARNNDQGVLVSFDIPINARVQAFWSGRKVAFDVLLMQNTKPVFADPNAPVLAPKTEEKIISQGPQKPQRVAGPAQTTPVQTTPASPPVNTPIVAHGLQTLADQMRAQQQNQQATQAAKTGTEQVDKKEEGTVIRFRFLERTHLAVFERAGRLWVVFSPAVKKIIPQVQGPLSRGLRQASKIESENGTAFIFTLPDDVQGMEHIAVEQDGLNWEIWLQDSSRQTATTGHMMLSTAGDGKNLTIDPDQQTYILPFEDKIVGDKIWVVPVLSPLLRAEYAQRMNSLRAVPSIVGGLFVPIRDNLNVQTNGTQFLIGDADGLLISADADRFQSGTQGDQQNLFKLHIRDESFLQFLRGRDDMPFEQQRQRLEQRLVAQKDDKARALYALDIARLYLGYGFGPEAGGALELAESFLPNLKDTPDFVALKGMSAALSGQTEKALDILSHDHVKEVHAARIWRAYAWAQDKNWERAYQIFKNVNDGFKSYPAHLRTRLLLAALESAVETGNMREADSFLRPLADASLTKAQVMTRAYAEAMIVKDRNPESALPLFEEITRSNDKYYRVKAELNIISISIANGRMTVPQAIERMEKLRYAWRGDRLEVTILRELGQYYIAHHNPMQAMILWQQAAKFAQQKEDQDQLRNDLQNSFNRIFVEGKQDHLQTLQILALYERFKHLMPKGQEGIKAAFHLVDQLQKVDLLDQADKILQDQLRHHATGEDAVKIGTHLAKIRLLARDPAGALKALDESDRDAMNEDMAARRIMLRARALADNQQMEQAIMTLGFPSNPEGLSLRADIYWRQQAWGDAAADLQELIDTTPDKTAQNAHYTALLLRLAIAKALQNDDLGLAQMAAQYGDLMKDAPEAKAFAVMTQPLGETSLADMETIRAQVAQVELFEKFLKNF